MERRKRRNTSTSDSILKIRTLLAGTLAAAAVYTTRNLLVVRPTPSFFVAIDQQHNPNFSLTTIATIHNTTSTTQKQATTFDMSTRTQVVDEKTMIKYKADIRRLCHCMVIGTQKGGTRALTDFLRFRHPSVFKKVGGLMPELHFFDHDWEKLMLNNFTNTTTTLPALLPGQELFLKYAFTRPMQQRSFVRADGHVIGVHASPDYLFKSDRVPSRVLSTCPDTKLVAILREPTSRAVSQYNHGWKYWNSTRKSSYPHRNPDEYIYHDIAQLKAAGVVQDWSIVNFDTFSGSMAEREAWTRYVNMVGGNGPVGRGLYAIQLRHWFAEFNKYGKPHSDMLILESSDTIANTTKEYAKVLDFLNLPAQTLLEEDAVKHETSHKAKAMDNTRAMLKAFFKPYNEQLYNLIGDGWDAKRW